jgi:SAM-dependent methyltransferase
MEGSTHSGWSVSKSVEYINRVFQDYLVYGGLSEADLAGKSILEVGPGDNLGVSLKFLAAGAAEAACLDRVFSIRDAPREWNIYSALRAECSETERAGYDAAIDLTDGIVLRPEKLRYIYGVGIEDAERLFPSPRFDLIVSRAVLMEVHRLDLAIEVMDRLLRPGGMMIHQIAPAHDYGIFTQHGYHSLEYLTIPDWLYKRMTQDSGKPNRRFIADYRSTLSSMGYNVQCHITAVIGSEGPEFPPKTFYVQRGIHYSDKTLALLRGIRPRLQPRFREAAEEELMVRGAFLVARKPA